MPEVDGKKFPYTPKGKAAAAKAAAAAKPRYPKGAVGGSIGKYSTGHKQKSYISG